MLDKLEHMFDNWLWKVLFFAGGKSMKYKKKVVELTEEIDNEDFWKFICGLITKFKTRWGL